MNTILKRVSVSILGLGALGLLSLTMSHASDRVNLTPDLLKQIEAIPNGTKRVSVYASRRIRVNYKQILGSGSRTSNGELELSSGKKDIDVVLKRKTRGQISKIERVSNVEIVTANFDPECKSESCMFRFARRIDCAEFSGCDQLYYLTIAPNAVAGEAGYSYSFTKSRGKRLFQKTPAQEGVHLDIVLSELSTSEHKKKPLDGVHPENEK